MPHRMPHLLYVSAVEPTAACASISAALRQAAAGDTGLVGWGRYAPSTTETEIWRASAEYTDTCLIALRPALSGRITRVITASGLYSCRVCRWQNIVRGLPEPR